MERPMARRAERLLLAAMAWIVSGCFVEPPREEEPIGFVLSSQRDVFRLRRVVFVELGADGGCEPGVAWDTTKALSSAIQGRRLFHVDLVRRTNPMCRDLALDQMGGMALDDLSRMRQALRCDAVLLGRVSHFQPFPRMQLGLVLKLMDLRDGKLLWGVEHVWDTTDRQVENRIRAYFRRYVRSGYEPMDHELVLKSPRAFERYIAHEVSRTLPSRPDPKATAATHPAGSRAVARLPRRKTGVLDGNDLK